MRNYRSKPKQQNNKPRMTTWKGASRPPVKKARVWDSPIAQKQIEKTAVVFVRINGKLHPIPVGIYLKLIGKK